MFICQCVPRKGYLFKNVKVLIYRVAVTVLAQLNQSYFKMQYFDIDKLITLIEL